MKRSTIVCGGFVTWRPPRRAARPAAGMPSFFAASPAMELESATCRSEPMLIALSGARLGLKGSSVGARRTTSATETYVSAVETPR
ncbi:hypothetical protein GCM10020254_29400 [Streptomyces goshikiensis]